MNNKNNTVQKTWFLPLLLIIGCFVVNYATGALDFRNISDERSQRDFNAALGMPLVMGYLWVALRLMHRHSANGIARFLVNTNQVNEFNRHVNVLERKLIRHTVLAAALAISVTLIYLVTEDLLAFNYPLSVLVLNVTAVPFWFLIFLFIMQSASFTRYLYRHLVLPNIYSAEHISHCKIISDLGIHNVILCLLMFALFPLFWFGKTVPAIDIVLMLTTTGVLTVLLFFPVIKMVLLMKKCCHDTIERLELSIREQMITARKDQYTRGNSEKINQLNQMVEDLKQLHCWPKGVLPDLPVFMIIITVPVLLLSMIWYTA